MKLINSKVTTLIFSTVAILALSGCGSEGIPSERGLSGTPTVTPPVDGNTPPVANAGVDQALFFGGDISLDGSASTDADGDTLTYAWTLTAPAGSTATLSDAATVNPTFTADIIGNYTLQLIVNDGTEDSIADSMTVAAQEVTSSGVAYVASDSHIQNMKLSSDGNTLYAAVASDTDVNGIGTEDGLNILNLSTGITENIASHPGRQLALSNDGTIAYVTSSQDSFVTKVNLETKTITEEIDLQGEHANGIAIGPDNNKLYIGSDDFMTLDLSTSTYTVDDFGGGYGNTVILSNDGTKVYYALCCAGFLTIDLNDTSSPSSVIETTESGPGRPMAAHMDIASDEKTAYVSLGSRSLGIDVVNIVDENITTTIYDINATAKFDWVKEVELSVDDSVLFVADAGYQDTLFIIDLTNNYAITSVVNTSTNTCDYPTSVKASEDGSKVYMGCGNGVIVEFDIK